MAALNKKKTNYINSRITWSLFLFFTFLHIWSNYRALRCLELNTFNSSRLLLSLDSFLNSNKIKSVTEINKEESLVIGRGITDRSFVGVKIELGVSLLSAFSLVSRSNVEKYLVSFSDKNFIIVPHFASNEIKIVLGEKVKPHEIIEAYARSIIYTHVLIKKTTKSYQILDGELIEPTVTKLWDNFKASVTEKGFILSIALLNTGDWRATWKND